MATFKPANKEFRVNEATVTIPSFTNPDLAITDNGDFIVVWQSPFTVNDSDILFRRFDAQGNAKDSFDRDIANSEDNEIEPKIIISNNGDFGVTFVKNNDIYFKIFNQNGDSLTEDILVSDFEQEKRQFEPDIAVDSVGNFVIVWTNQSSSNNLDVRGRLFDSLGNSLTPDQFIFNNPYNEYQPSVAIKQGVDVTNLTDADFSDIVVTHTSEVNDYPQIFAGSVGNLTQISTSDDGSPQTQSAIAIDDNGNVIITWTYQFADNDRDIKFRRFDRQGDAIDLNDQFVDDALNSQSNSAVAFRQDGSFVVTYENAEDDSVKYAQFNANGQRQGIPQNYDTTANIEKNPVVAIANNTMVIVADDSQTHSFDPYARIFQTDSLLNTPIYRFQNNDRPGTYLFVGQGEREQIKANFPNFVEEGFAFNVSNQPNDNLIRLNRFQNKDVPGTYLYANEQESISIRQNFPNFAEEGLAFYVYDGNANQAENFYRFQNSAQPGTYLFASQQERNTIVANFPTFREEGVAFEAGL